MIGPLKLEASVCHSTLKEGVHDTAEIFVTSASSVTATVHVNWITPTKIRTIRVTGTRGVCFVDYILQTCEVTGGGLLDYGAQPESVGYDAIQEGCSSSSVRGSSIWSRASSGSLVGVICLPKSGDL